MTDSTTGTENFLQYSLTIDESRLQQFMKSLAHNATEQLRQEIVALQRGIFGLRESVSAISEDLRAAHKRLNTLEAKFDATQTRMDESELIQNKFFGLTTESRRKLLQNISGKGGVSEGTWSADPTGEKAHEKFNAVVLQLNELKLQSDEARVEMQQKQEAMAGDFNELLQCLGLDHTEGEWRQAANGDAEGPQAAPVGVAEGSGGSYLQPTNTTLSSHDKRLLALESSIAHKSDKSEMNLVALSVTDVRGFFETSVRRLEHNARKLTSSVDTFSDQFHTQIATKVSGTDLDKFKGELGGVALRAEEEAKTSLEAVERLEKEFGVLKASLVDLLDSRFRRRKSSISPTAAEAEPQRRPSSAGPTKKKFSGCSGYTKYAEVTADPALRVGYSNFQQAPPPATQGQMPGLHVRCSTSEGSVSMTDASPVSDLRSPPPGAHPRPMSASLRRPGSVVFDRKA